MQKKNLSADPAAPAVNKSAAKPPWIRVRLGNNETFGVTRRRLRHYGLNTVCEEAACPNLGRCWAKGRATIMLLGEHCTRGCRFCNVEKHVAPPPDPSEPERVAAAVKESGLREVVLTSVTRDDLDDGGAAHWAACIGAVRAAVPETLIEVLVPDFAGNPVALEVVMAARAHIFGHNLETVPRLYPAARPQADYQRSLTVLKSAAQAGLIVKTSLMLGLGESHEEVLQVMRDALAAGCSIFYVGQYLQPSQQHLPVARYPEPEEFERIETIARELGFGFVASAPLVRSSYHEDGQSAFVRLRLKEF